MSELRKNWRDYHPPMVPIYYMEYEALEKLLETNPAAISDDGLELMLGYFEEYEQFEKATLIRDAKWRRGMFEMEEPPGGKDLPLDVETTFIEDDDDDVMTPPNDGHEWKSSSDGQFWSRPLTDEEVERYFGKPQPPKVDNDENPYEKDNPFS